MNINKFELLIPLIFYIHTSKIKWFHQGKIKIKNKNKQINNEILIVYLS